GAPESQRPPTPGTSDSVPQNAGGETADARAAAAIPERDVRTLVDAWKSTQNARDHAAYARLYAARFEGVRRAGPRVRRFDRAGWLADRRNMFSLPMAVETADVRVSSSGQSAIVRFTQSFSAGQFRDRGPKELVVVREGGELRIAREEMLASDVLASSAPAPQSGARGDFFMVIDEGDTPQPYVVLSAEPDEAWGGGPISLLTRRRPLPQTIVTRRAASAAPAEVSAWRGRAVHLYAADGQSCTAHLADLFLLSRVDVHFGTEQRWAGDEDGDGQNDRPPANNAEIAGSAFGPGMLLVASLRERGCSGLWARAADRPAPAIFAQTTTPSDLAARALAAFRATPAWRTLQTEYAADGNATPNGRWDEHQRPSHDVRVWEHAASSRRFVSVTAATSTGGCADFSGQLWALFEAPSTGSDLVLRSDGASPSFLSPAALADVDGDGTPEVVTDSGIARRRGTAWTVTEDVAPENHDCGC
ncbi:MAG: DUF4440 domain-containing protein, partial [Deltaproteobacteria bacterium]|nr:DUF4440 domain-containing protein [Deltaproteobacteria bacterium]